jgi:GAF domain-containing protein
MATPMIRPGSPTPRSSAAIVLHAELTELHEDRARLKAEVARLERHVSMLSTEVASADQKAADLEKLLHAARRLESCADRAAVLAALQDILVTVVGSDDFVVLALDEEGRTMWPILGVGANGTACGPLLVSDALVSTALETGKCQIAGPRGVGELPRNEPLASAPLLSWPHTVGALVVFTLVAKRSVLRPIDVELLEFLSSHAATAIQLADLRSAETRRPPSLL